MTDLAALTADQLAALVANGILNVKGSGDTAVAALSELVRRASERDQAVRKQREGLKRESHYRNERDQAVRERDGARLALESNAPLILDLTERADRLAAALYEVVNLSGRPYPIMDMRKIARDALAASQEQA